MPEPSVLYAVTAAVVAGLVVWVAVALRTAKQPWALPGAAEAEREAALRDEPAKAEPAKAEPAKAEPVKDEPAKDEPAEDEPQDEPASARTAEEPPERA